MYVVIAVHAYECDSGCCHATVALVATEEQRGTDCEDIIGVNLNVPSSTRTRSATSLGSVLLSPPSSLRKVFAPSVSISYSSTKSFIRKMSDPNH